MDKIMLFLRTVIFSMGQSFFRFFGYPVIYNANGCIQKESKKSALLIYLSTPFAFFGLLKPSLDHQNFKQCRQIVRLLGDQGYCVDVVDHRDDKFVPGKPYDLVISHRLSHKFPEVEYFRDAFKVYLATSLAEPVYDSLVRKRYDDLWLRKGVSLTVRRPGVDRMPYLECVDAVVCFGNSYTVKTWQSIVNIPVLAFNNYAFDSIRSEKNGKDFSKARKKFLFFASKGQVGKGLDLLLEIFASHSDLELYICSDFRSEKDFCRLYEKELFQTDNIHAIGWVKVGSKEFYALCRKCAYVVLPSAAEAQAGSVLQCMKAGLIPIVTREVCLDDVPNYGIILDRVDLDYLGHEFLRASSLSPASCQEMCRSTIKHTVDFHSEAAFLIRWKEIIVAIGQRSFGPTA